MDGPVGSREGGGGGNKKQTGRDEARRGSQLTRKQRKVCSKLYSGNGEQIKPT